MRQCMYKCVKAGVVAATMVMVPAVSNAADLYRPAPPVLYNWTGFYVGAHVGGIWDGGDNGDGGFIGGGQVGFNYQVNQWVLGVEGDLAGTSVKESVFASNGLQTLRVDASLDWVSTFAARAGWAVDRWLVYGKIGGAWAHASADASFNTPGMILSGSVDRTVSGLLLGVGTEYALWDNWTAKVEYNMMDFGGDIDSKTHVLKAGLNYRFNFGPGRY